MSLYAKKSNQYSLFGSLIATPELSTERVVISGDDKIGQINVTIDFSLGSDANLDKLSNPAQVYKQSSWKDKPSKNSIFSINFRKYLKIHVIQLYGNYASNNIEQYINLMEGQDIRAFYKKFKDDMTVPTNTNTGLKQYVIPATDSYVGSGRGFSDLSFQKTFSIFHNQTEPLNLSYFLIPYIDLQQLKEDFTDMDLQILFGDYDGDIRAVCAGVPVYQSALYGGEVRSTARVYETIDGKYWTGHVVTTKEGNVFGKPGDVELSVRKVSNHVVQDARRKSSGAKANLSFFKKFLTTPSANSLNKEVSAELIKVNPKKTYFSDLFMSTDVNGASRGFFMFNMEEYLKAEAVFSGLMTISVNDVSSNSSIVSASSLKTIKVFRKQVKETLSPTMEKKYAAGEVEENNKQLLAVGVLDPLVSDLVAVNYTPGTSFTLRLEDVDFDTSSYGKPSVSPFVLRKFAFYDEGVRNFPGAKFQYEVELEVEDGSVSFIKALYGRLNQSVHDMEALMNDITRPGIPGMTPYYDYEKDKFTSSWKNGAAADYDTKLRNAITSYVVAYGAFLAPSVNVNTGLGNTVKSDLARMMSMVKGFLNYNNASLTTYNIFMKMQKELKSMIESFIKMKGGRKMLAGADSAPGGGNTGSTPRVNKIRHTFKNIFDTASNLEGMTMGYDILLNADSEMSKAILQKAGTSFQRGLLVIEEEQFRARARQETKKYFKKTMGPLVIPGESVDLSDAEGNSGLGASLGLTPGTELFSKQIEGGDINDNALTYLTPASIMLHGKVVDLATINAAKDTKSSVPLGERKYPRAVVDVLLKKYGIDQSYVKDAPVTNPYFGQATQVAPLSAGGVIQSTPPPYVSPGSIPLSAPTTVAPKKDKTPEQIRSDAHMVLNAAGISVYPDANHMPETNKQDELVIAELGMGGILAGSGFGFAPFDPEEMGRLRWGSPEVEGPENGDLDLKPPPLSFSMAMLSNVLFNKSSAKKSINDFREPPVDEENLNVLPELPNQLKSLYAGVHENNLIKTKILSDDKDIVNDYKSLGLYYFNYQLIYKIEVLTGFESNGTIGPKYEPLSDSTIENYRGRRLLCRATLYDNSKIIDSGVHAKMHLPLLNEFFLLEVAGIKPEDLAAEVDDSIEGNFQATDFVFIPPIAIQEDTDSLVSDIIQTIIPGLAVTPPTGGGYRS